MKAAVSSEKGLEVRDIPQPKPKPNEILVRVKARGLNRADLNAARGAGGHGAVGNVVGLDWSGEVVEVGNEVQGRIQTRRSRDVRRRGRLCGICGGRLGTRGRRCRKT